MDMWVVVIGGQKLMYKHGGKCVKACHLMCQPGHEWGRSLVFPYWQELMYWKYQYICYTESTRKNKIWDMVPSIFQGLIFFGCFSVSTFGQETMNPKQAGQKHIKFTNSVDNWLEEELDGYLQLLKKWLTHLWFESSKDWDPLSYPNLRIKPECKYWGPIVTDLGWKLLK